MIPTNVERNKPTDLYTFHDWAHLFILCAEAEGSEEDTQSPHWIEVNDWLHEFAREHDLSPPIDLDVSNTIKSAIMFLNKFAENQIDDMFDR